MDAIKRVPVLIASNLALAVAVFVGLFAWIALLPFAYFAWMADELERYIGAGSNVFLVPGLPFVFLAWVLTKVFYFIWPLAGPYVDFVHRARARPGFLGKLSLILGFNPAYVERAMRLLRDGFEEFRQLRHPAASA